MLELNGSVRVTLKNVAIIALVSLPSAAFAQEVRVVTTVTGNGVSGQVVLREMSGTERVDVTARITGLADGSHAIHVHERGDCGNPGGDFDAGPNKTTATTNHPFHHGDLPNLVSLSGLARISHVSTRFRLAPGPLALDDEDGASIVIHAGADTFVAGGDGGAIVACGVLYPDLSGTLPALSHHYTFNGDANDQVGTAHGTLLGGATASGGLLTLNGTTAFVDFNTHIVPHIGPYTVAFFAREIAPGPGYVEMISQGFSGDGFYIGHTPAPAFIRASDDWVSTSEPFPSDGLEHHYALVMDVAADQARLYIDGVLQQTHAAFATAGGGEHTKFGNQFGGFNEFFNGTLADVRIYPSALTAAQIGTLVPEQVVAHSHTGSVQTFTVPPGITSIRAKLWGAGGGPSTGGPDGGYGAAGGFTDGIIAVTPDEVLTIVVGGGGSAQTFGGGGGGMSAVLRGATPLLVAGGGGGGGRGPNPGGTINSGGAGGGSSGGAAVGNGTPGAGGGGGTQVAGGAAFGFGEPGTALQGGNASASSFPSAIAYGGGGRGDSDGINWTAGGGGGGFFGGGAGGGSATFASGGGGGSGFIGGVGVSNATTVAGTATTPPAMGDIDYVVGVARGRTGSGTGGDNVNGGPGRVVIRY